MLNSDSSPTKQYRIKAAIARNRLKGYKQDPFKNKTVAQEKKETIPTGIESETDNEEGNYPVQKLKPSSPVNGGRSEAPRRSSISCVRIAPKRSIGEISHFIFRTKTEFFCGGRIYEEQQNYEFLHTQYLYNCGLQCLFSLMSIASAIIEYEATVFCPKDNSDKLVYLNVRNDTLLEMHNISFALVNNLNRSALTSSWFSFINSVLLWVCIVFDYFISCKILQYAKRLNQEIWKRDFMTIFELVCTLIFFFPHPNPATYGINITSYNEKLDTDLIVPLNAYFTAIVLLRLWYPLKLILASSPYTDTRSERICEMNSFDTSLGYSFKAIMVDESLIFDFRLLLGALFICSYSLRIFERDINGSSELGLGNYYNSLWCMFITMTTIGYGDYSPSTSFGRLYVIIGCLFGVFLISLIVVSVSNILNLKGAEKNIYLVLERADLMAEKDALASSLVARYSNLHKMIKIHNQTSGTLNPKFEKRRDIVLKKLFDYNEKCNEIDSTYPPYSSMDNIMDNLVYLEKTVSNFNKKYSKLKALIDKIAVKVNVKNV